jgi:phospholipid/cholesterol/gamma-HCH transport system substrate-binding protein
MERDLARDIKVGVFVVGVLALGGLGAYLLGGSSELFKERYTLHASFSDVAGLRTGAVVRLAGIDVGEVKGISFSEDPGVKRIFVSMEVNSEYSERIRSDSEARIETEGMLGDKYISISVGSLERSSEGGERELLQPLQDDDWIQVTETPGLLEYQGKATEVLDNVKDITEKINLSMGNSEDAEAASIARIAQQVEQLLTDAQEGRGLIYALVYDEQMSASINRTIANLETASGAFSHMAYEIQTGDGLAHELIYGDEGEALAKDLGDLSRALSALVKDIEGEDGLLNALVYDETLTSDLKSTAESLRIVAEAMENGEGTAGMLARDPELYEDLRALVGGAQRNKLLRSYVRATVARGEEKDASSWEE